MNSLKNSIRQHLPHTQPARACLLGILATFLILSAYYSVTIPIFEASDELWHYPMVEIISRTWTLPVQPLEPGTTSGPWRQEASQQPLYYFLGAVLTSWIDTTDMPEVRQPNPHARAGEITPELDNANLVIHNPVVERFPWTGTVLAVHLVRFFSVLLGVWAVYLTWALIHELFPDKPWIALATAGVHAFTPMYLFISSSVNNDNLIVPLCSWALLLMLRRVKAADRSAAGFTLTRSSIGIGLVMGLAMLTKTSAIGLLPFVAATLAWEAWRRPGSVPWRHRILRAVQHAALIAAPILAISGWWYVRNLRLYGDLLGWNAFGAVLGTRDVPANLGQLWAERMAFAAGYWGNFGGLNVPLPTWAYTLLNALAVAAAAGLVLRLGLWLTGHSVKQINAAAPHQPLNTWINRIWPFAWTPMTAAHALAWAWPAAIFISWSRWATLTWSSQGRLIFPAIPMWSLALVLGLTAWMPRKARVLSGVALASLLFSLTLTALPLWILPAYRAPEAITEDTPLTDYDPAGTQFGHVLELVGYRVITGETAPDGTLEVELVWRAIDSTPTYHSLFIHVLGEGERIIAQRDTFPGHGRLPTTQLTPGYTWIERHVLRMSHTAFTPDTLTLAVGVYETATGTRITPAKSTMDGGADTLRFGQIALIGTGSIANEVNLRFGEGIVLQSYNVSDLVLTPGAQVEIDLNWLCTAPIDHDYTVSVQLIDDRWNKAAQSDAGPLEGRRPTTSWQSGEVISEFRVLTIAPGTPPGAYKLRLALYRPTPEGELEHLPVSQSREGMPAKAIELTTLRITE